MEAELWFGDLVSFLANVMPDVNRKELPACMTVQRVYSMYREAMQKGGNKPLQMTQFRRMWQRRFPEVIIPKILERLVLNTLEKRPAFCYRIIKA